MESQIQFLEERLAARKKKRRSGRHSVNPSSPVPTTVVKTKEYEVPKTFPSAPSAAVTVEDLPNGEDKHLDSCSDKTSVLSTEEATDHFIAELKQEISMRNSSGILINIQECISIKCVLLRC